MDKFRIFFFVGDKIGFMLFNLKKLKRKSDENMGLNKSVASYSSHKMY